MTPAITELDVTGLTSDREMTCLARRQKPEDASVSNVQLFKRILTSPYFVGTFWGSGEVRSLSLAGPVSHRGAQHGSPLERQGHNPLGVPSPSQISSHISNPQGLLNRRSAWHIFGRSEFIKFPVTAAIGGI